MNESSSEPTLPILSVTNFPFWKFKIRCYLLANDLGQAQDQTLSDDPTKREIQLARRARTTRILECHVDRSIYNRFSAEFATEDPTIIWNAITDRFESKADDNQSKVFLDFMAIKYKSNDHPGFIADLNHHLSSMNSVGIVISKPTGADIKESLVAEIIVNKLPTEFTSMKEFLFTRRPLTLEMVKDALEKKHRDSSIVSSTIKSEGTAYTAYKACSNGKHNPLTKHSKSEYRQLIKNKSKARNNPSPKVANVASE